MFESKIYVELLSPRYGAESARALYNTAYAMTTCTMNERSLDYDEEDTSRYEELIKKLIDKNHTSVLEHLNYTFSIEGISRALLQEISRHRHTSPTVQSTRWALKKMECSDPSKCIYIPEELDDIDRARYIEACMHLLLLRKELSKKYTNDIAKYATVESMLTKEVLTVNARSLINMFELRTSPAALKEFKDLMYKIYLALPQTHVFIFKKYEERFKA